MLEYEGARVAQSEAVWRLAANVAGLAGDGPLQAAQADMVGNHAMDVLSGENRNAGVVVNWAKQVNVGPKYRENLEKPQ